MKYDVEALLRVTEEELNEIQGVGEVLAKAFNRIFFRCKACGEFQKAFRRADNPGGDVNKETDF